MVPTISVVIPTLNSEKVLDKCLASISKQKYPQEKVEIVIADGGSKDRTLSVAKRYRTVIVPNPLKTAEAGKVVGIKAATGQLIALIDSDNILPNNHWFADMVKPFADLEMVLSEPIKYTYRKSDFYLTRYFALLGMNDPICLFTGNYDRYSYITDRWTNLIFPEKKRKGYLEVIINKEPIPTIGANGTIFRSELLKVASKKSDYLFDIDILLGLVRKRGGVKIAKVSTGIVHTFVENDMFKFFRKQLRRINDMSFHKSKNNRELDWQKTFFFKIVGFGLSCLLIIPIFYQTLKGYFRKPDVAWFFHPIACYSTLFIYLYGWILGKIKPAESSRHNWKQ